MFWTASDVFKKRLAEGRIEEAEKIYLALKRLVPSIEAQEKSQAGEQSPKRDTVAGFMYYAECLIKESEHYRKKYFAIRSKKAAKAIEGTSKEPEGTSGLNTD